MSKTKRDPIKTLHTEAKRNAKRRGISHSITLDNVVALAKQADGRCQLSGIEFSDEMITGSVRPYAASIDRIDSAVGYHPGNVRLVCIAVNNAMREWGEIVLYVLLSAILSKHMENLNVEEEGPQGRPGEVGREAGR